MRGLSRTVACAVCLLLSFGTGLRAQQSASPKFTATLGHSTATLTGPWRFRTGDDLAWANPALDDSKWETISTEQPWGAQGHPGYTGFAWYRRAVEISGVTGPVSIYLPQVDDAYEVFWNGKRIGGFGKLPPHAMWNPGSVSNIFALPDPEPSSGGNLSGVLAIKVWAAMSSSEDSSDSGGLNGPPKIGDSKTMADALRLEEETSEQALWIHTLGCAILLFAGVIAIGMWAVEPSRRLPLWLGVFLVALGGEALPPLPGWLRFVTINWHVMYRAVIWIARDLSLWMLVSLLFGLDREHLWRRVTGVLVAIYLTAYAIDVLALWLWPSGWVPLQTIDHVAAWTYVLLPTYLFVLLIAGLRRRRDLALVPMVLACTALEGYQMALFALAHSVRLTGYTLDTLTAATTLHLGAYNLSFNSQLQAVVMIVLIWTVYREQARERKRQVFVESEMKSAREIQQVLVPEETPAVPGFAISSLYWPASEVGGDLFQVLPGGEGDVLVVLADVSGKGLKAAMTVSLMVGAARTLAETTSDPHVILAGLNRRLVGRTNGGFATCLVLHVSAAGSVTMANAGHLATFLNGEAMEMEGSLPLGISYDAEFSGSAFSLREGDEVALYTDGVLEAQNKAGELYGFDRCAELMRARPSVQAIAEAAKAFGQEDDITVVKIVRIHEEDARERMSVDLRTVAVA